MTTTPVIIPECRIAPPALITQLPCERQTVGRLYATHPPRPMPAHGESGLEWEPREACSPSVESYCPGCEVPGDPKIFHEQDPVRSAVPVSLYGSFACSGPGWTAAEIQDRARRDLENGEEFAVERELIHAIAADPGLDNLDVGAGVSLVSAVTRIGNWAATQVCLPTLHVPRGLLNTLAAFNMLATTPDDPIQRLHDGTLVVAGAGYDNLSPAGVPGGDSEYWLYASGPVRIWRGDIFEPSAELAAQLDRGNNDRQALAERTAVVGWDCGSAVLRTVIE